MICLLNGDVSGFRYIHLWTHGTAASLHVDGFSTRQRWAADSGAESLALQAVAVCAAVDVPALLVCVGFSTEVAHHFLCNCIFNTVRTTLSLSQNRSLTGYWWARLGVASNDTIHANAASADIGLPGLSCQKNISFIIFAVTRHALIA